MAGLYDVTLQSGYPRNVVKLEEIMDPRVVIMFGWLVESARGESLILRRCLNLVVNGELSLFSGCCARLDIFSLYD